MKKQARTNLGQFSPLNRLIHHYNVASNVKAGKVDMDIFFDTLATVKKSHIS